MSFFSSLAKSVGGIVGGAVGTVVLPGVGTALGAALGGALGGAAYGAADDYATRGQGGAPSLAPGPTYAAVQRQGVLMRGTPGLLPYQTAQRTVAPRGPAYGAHGTAAGTREEQRVLALMRARRAAKGLVPSSASAPMSTGKKVALAAGGG